MFCLSLLFLYRVDSFLFIFLTRKEKKIFLDFYSFFRISASSVPPSLPPPGGLERKMDPSMDYIRARKKNNRISGGIPGMHSRRTADTKTNNKKRQQKCGCTNNTQQNSKMGSGPPTPSINYPHYIYIYIYIFEHKNTTKEAGMR